MQSSTPPPGDSSQPRQPWDVFRAKHGSRPPNELRYVSAVRFAVSVAVVAVLITVIVIPTRSVETEMHAAVEAAKNSGFPQLPTKFATTEEVDAFIAEWDLNEPGSPSRPEIKAMSERVGDYRDDSAIFNLGIVAGLIALVFLSAAAFTRALNNLYALGYEFSTLSPSWAFLSWFIPILGTLLTWRVVAETLSLAWPVHGAGERPQGARWTQVVAGLWGVSFLGLWLFNPFTANVFLGTDNIDQWLNKIIWTGWMLVWLPIAAFFTASVLVAVTFRQHRRYRLLDARAKPGG